MMEDIFEYQDMLLDELHDIVIKKENGVSLTETDLCNGKVILESIDYISEIQSRSSNNELDYETYPEDSSYTNSYRRNRSMSRDNMRMSNNNSYRSYRGRRSGHNENHMLRAEIERKLNTAKNDTERRVYEDWLIELDNAN